MEVLLYNIYKEIKVLQYEINNEKIVQNIHEN